MSAPKDIVIEITEEGSCLAIWDDSNPLQVVGEIQVTRLSDVEFDNELQGWVVKFRNGVILANVYPERIRALAAEIAYVEANLDEFGDWVRQNFPERVPQAPMYDAGCF